MPPLDLMPSAEPSTSTASEARDAGAGDAGNVEDPPPDASRTPTCSPSELLGPDGNCYLVVATLRSWAVARLGCAARGEGWDLAAIESQALTDFVTPLLTDETWIGASDLAVEGTWRWVRDERVFWIGDGDTGNAVAGAYDNWNETEPNGDADSDCARAFPGAGRGWSDLECAELRSSLCAGPPQ
jgi:hypothetical protein